MEEEVEEEVEAGGILVEVQAVNVIQIAEKSWELSLDRFSAPLSS